MKRTTIPAEPRNGPRNREDIPARLAQLAEHRTCNPGVASSTLAVGFAAAAGIGWTVKEFAEELSRQTPKPTLEEAAEGICLFTRRQWEAKIKRDLDYGRE